MRSTGPTTEVRQGSSIVGQQRRTPSLPNPSPQTSPRDRFEDNQRTPGKRPERRKHGLKDKCEKPYHGNFRELGRDPTIKGKIG